MLQRKQANPAVRKLTRRDDGNFGVRKKEKTSIPIPVHKKRKLLLTSKIGSFDGSDLPPRFARIFKTFKTNKTDAFTGVVITFYRT